MAQDSEPHNPTSRLQSATHLRLATAIDLPAILTIAHASFPLPWKEEAFRSELRNPCSQLWVAEEGTHIIGYACAWFVQDEGQIVNVAVLPQYRRYGVGKALIQYLIQEARIRGVRTLSLEVRKSNHAAVELYKAFGFQVVTVRKRYYENDEDALLMVCTVSPW
jgi:[ribosomal protein S18]-alanine N-acetyltransferase